MIERGEIWWADVGPPTGSVPGHRRPVVVISADAFNASRIGTVVVAVLTSNTDRAAAPGNVMTPAEVSGLERDSVINVGQVTTLDKRTLTSRVSRLPFDVLDRLDAGLRLALDLTAWAHGPPERQLVTGDARCDTGDGNSRQGRVKVGEESVNPLKWGRAPNDEQMSHPARWLSPPRVSNEAPRSRHRRRFVASRDAATHRPTHQPRDRVELVVAPSTVKTHVERLLAKTGRRDRIELGEFATTATGPA